MSHRSRQKRQGERGFVLTLFTLMMLFVLVPIVGLAIDSGIMYMVKGKLQTAVDGAALGAARTLSANVSLAQQESTAGAEGIADFHANFPTGWMNITPVNDPTVYWGNSTTSTAVVDITGTVNSPTWFMKILGFNGVTVTATSEATRRNLNVILVIDRSTSLQDEGNCPTLITDAQDFVNNSFVEGRDQVAMVTFGTSFNYDFAFNTTFKSTLTTDLSNLVCTGFTNAASAFSLAYQELFAQNGQNALNVIVFFTDGEPNTMTFGINTCGGSAAPCAKATSYPFAASSSSTYNPLMTLTTSSCNPHTAGSTISGVIAGDVTYNTWGGVFNWTNSGIGHLTNSDFNVVSTPTGCAFSSSDLGTGGSPSFKSDIQSLPSADAFGNYTNRTWSGGILSPFPYSVSTGSSWYSLQNLENAGTNTLDNAAENARVAAAANSLPFVVYTIGLNPTVYGSINQTLLERVANDPASPVYSTSYTAGKFYYVPSAGELSQAFAAIASDILRISK